VPVHGDAGRDGEDAREQSRTGDRAEHHRNRLAWRHPDRLEHAKVVYALPGVKHDGVEHAEPPALPGAAGCRIIILTTFDLDQYVYTALTAGASGFLLKDVSPEQLVDAVRTIRSGDAPLAPSITRRLVERFASSAAAPAPMRGDLSELTPRELEVLQLLARGMSNAELAAELVLSEATVKTHVARILRKLGLRDRVQAVVLAYQTGLATAHMRTEH
jgi:DNA-binding NarL/FixJ family response regulator